MSNNITISRVAVLLAAYNGGSFIEQQVESILGQRDVFVDVYISLDISTDDSEECCRRLAARSSSVFLIFRKATNSSSAQNFNYLLSIIDPTGYDFFAFSDQDDIWMEDKLHASITALTASGSVAYSSNVVAFWSNGSTKLLDKCQPQKTYDYLFESPGPGCTFVLRKDIFLELKCFLSETKSSSDFPFHDLMYYAFVRSRGYKWFIDARPYLYYRQHDFNVVGANLNLRSKWKRIRILISGLGFNYIDHLLKIVGPISKYNIPRRFDIPAILFFLKHFKQLRRKKLDQYILFIFLLGSLCLRVMKSAYRIIVRVS